MSFDVKYIIELIDKFSPEARNIVVMQKNITINMHRMEEKTKKATHAFKNFGKTLSLHVSTPLGVGIGVAIHHAAKFEQSMATIKSVTEATVPQMMAFKKATLLMGASNRISAQDIGMAESEMAKYHIGLKQISKLIGVTVPFATANTRKGIIDIVSASKIAVRASKGLGLSFDQLPGFLEAVTAAAHKSGFTLSEFYQSLKYTDTTMRALKVPFKDAIAYTGAMALQMKSSGQGARGTRMMMSKLQHPTKQMAHLFKRLGIQVFEAHGKFLGFHNMFKVLGETFKDSPVMSQQAMDTFRSVLMSGVKGYDEMRKSTDDTLVQNRLYQDQNASLAGSLDKLTNSMKSLSTSMVESQLGPLQGMINTMQRFIVKGLRMSDTTKGVITSILGIATVAGPAITSLAMTAAAFKYLGVSIFPIIRIAKWMWIAATGPAAPFIIAIGLAITALYELYSHFAIVRSIVKFFAKGLLYAVEHPINTLIFGLKKIGHAFQWLYNLFHSKPLRVNTQIGGIGDLSTTYKPDVIEKLGHAMAYGGVSGLNNKQNVFSSMNINVNDPAGYISSIASTSGADAFNVSLGNNMSYAR